MSRSRYLMSSGRPALARLGAVVDGLSDKAIARADKRAAATVRRRIVPAASRLVREVYNVSLSAIRQGFVVEAGEASGEQYVSLRGKTRKVPLVEFGGRWAGRKSSGATAQILRDSGRKTYKHFFIRTIGGERRMLVRQFSRDSHLPHGRDPRNKLRRVAGPSPYQMVVGIDGINAKRLAEQMNRLRASEIIRLLKVERKGAGK